jgi:hypothetical protein
MKHSLDCNPKRFQSQTTGVGNNTGEPSHTLPGTISEAFDKDTSRVGKGMKRFTSMYMKESKYKHPEEIDWAYASEGGVKITTLLSDYDDY